MDGLRLTLLLALRAGSGDLAVSELIAATKTYGSEVEAEWSESVIRDCMTRFDANKDGSLCIAEFERALAELSRTNPGKKKGKGKGKPKGRNQSAAMMGAVNANMNQADLIAGVAANKDG